MGLSVADIRMGCHGARRRATAPPRFCAHARRAKRAYLGRGHTLITAAIGRANDKGRANARPFAP
jgi:hypothetical protein